MSVLLVLCLAFFVLLFAGAWIVFRVIGMVCGALFWTARTAFGAAPRPRDSIATAERCANDRCNAPWRDGARFCPRCGQARRAMLPAPTSGDLDLAHRPARAMTRVA